MGLGLSIEHTEDLEQKQTVTVSPLQAAGIVASILIPLFICTWYLSGRMQRVEDSATNLEKRFDRYEQLHATAPAIDATNVPDRFSFNQR